MEDPTEHEHGAAPDAAPDAGAVPDQGAAAGAQPPSEEELREAYAAELRRITAPDLILQSAASLVNVGAYRLGLAGGDPADRDLEQVRDAIDGVRVLLPILERRGAAEQLRPLRDALSQLQLAYAREMQGGAGQGPSQAAADQAAAAGPSGEAAPGAGEEEAEPASGEAHEGDERRPGPAQSSGRLWVPGER